MNRIDKLIIRAKRIARPGVELVVAIIEQNGNSWIDLLHLSDGVTVHTPTIKRATFATLGAAVAHIHAVAEEYPNSLEVPIIIDDLV